MAELYQTENAEIDIQGGPKIGTIFVRLNFTKY